jgi:FKBP-type peptidyl-prolyl cis-trans isomerase FklB
MKKLFNVALCVFMAVAMFSCNAQVPKADLKTDIDSLSYAQGIVMANQQVQQIFEQFELDEVYKADFIRGFQEGFAINPKDQKTNAQLIGKMVGHQMRTQFLPYFNQSLFGQDSDRTISESNFAAGYIANVENKPGPMDWMQAQEAVQRLAGRIQNEKFEHLRQENLNWLENNKSNEGVQVTASGLQYKVITQGTGPRPAATDQVTVDYQGTNIFGETFDSSIERGQPATFFLNQVIAGWTEGVQLMPVGSKYVFYIPYNLAYGEQAHPQNPAIGPFATLIFEVELHNIVK